MPELFLIKNVCKHKILANSTLRSGSQLLSLVASSTPALSRQFGLNFIFDIKETFTVGGNMICDSDIV